MFPEDFATRANRMDYVPYLLALFIAAFAFNGWRAFRSDRFMNESRKRAQESMDLTRESMDANRKLYDETRSRTDSQYRESLSNQSRIIALLEEQLQVLRERLPAADKHP